MAYSHITFLGLKNALLRRLQDSAGVSTTPGEAAKYLMEALRVLNAQTAIWNTDYLFNFNPGDTWKTLNISGSPRQRTITDTSIYSEMEYMLMESPSGGVWTGTTQFTIAALSNALQYRRDEILLLSGANPVNLTNIVSPNVGVTTILPDNVLNLNRVRWISVDSSSVYALSREDIVSANAYGDQLSLQPGLPESWMITANTPLMFDVSCTPNTPGKWDLLTVSSGAVLAPPADTILGLPDDWCWLAKYGALADLLSNSPEASDPLRAKYCLSRYQRGLKAIRAIPWLLDATIAGLPVDAIAVEEADTYAQNWERSWPASDPQIVVGGIDLIALAPFTTGPTVSSVLTVVGNAPMPNLDSDFIQLSRDGMDSVLNYAQHIAMFKYGGQEFSATFPLLKQFEEYCALQNSRYAALGIFRPDMILEGNRSNDLNPRFEGEKKDAQPSR